MTQHQQPLLFCSQDQEWKARDVATTAVDFTALMSRAKDLVASLQGVIW